jgi:hypothetical protein
MAKKQTRRSVSLNRGTYERLRAYCETNDLSMSEFVEMRIGDFLGRSRTTTQTDGSMKKQSDPADRIFTF